MNKNKIVSLFLAGVLASSFAQSMAQPAAAASSQMQSPQTPLLLTASNTSNAPDKGAVLQILKGKPAEIDGSCGDYGDATSEAFADGSSSTGKVYFKHDSTYLYVCMAATPGSFKTRFGSVYLDPQGDGNTYTFANKADYALQVNLDSSNQSWHGTSVSNGYNPDTTIPSFWDGKYALSPTGGNESFEYRLSLGRFKLGECGQSFGLAAYHHWFAAVGDDYGYPSNQWFDQPGTWASATLLNPPCTNPEPQNGRIAYVYRGNTADATTFRNFLISKGFSVTLVPLGNVLATDFNLFDLTLIANDSGSLNDWGSSGLSAAQVAKIIAPNKPVLGLGEGGYAFFGQPALSEPIGWPHGWHGPDDQVAKAATAPSAIYTAALPNPLKVYSEPNNHVGIYTLPAPLPAGVIPVGDETPNTNHSTIIFDGCYFLWGFSGNPSIMTSDGADFFINYVKYARFFQCAPPPVEKDCLQLTKRAVPADGTPVIPGSAIQYTLAYTLSNATGCKDHPAKLTDVVPDNTIYVPGSASNGVAPLPDHSLNWVVGPAITNPITGTQVFRVIVNDTACRTPEQMRIHNQARIFDGVHPPVLSNIVSHPVRCPPIGFPNENPPYAEDEVQIHPYPIVAGHASEIKVRLTNNTPTATTVLVSFQTSPDKFGIGIPFGTLVSKSVTIPGNSNVVMTAPLTLLASGHYCIQIRVDIPGYGPIFTQRNLDVNEDLKPGIADTLTFAVGNPTTATQNIALVVDNTCPGFTAIVSPSLISNLAPGAVVSASLIVTPPNPVNLGSGCHIDVQGWLLDSNGNRTTLIGGVRKLDVPPVRLPENIQPPWLEPEISVKKEPITATVPNSICVELQNPTPFTKTVIVEYAVADFGAGIGFTPVATKVVTLPPNSLAKYCADWTPLGTGTLHRCILITLKQPNYRDQHSQRNVNIVKRPKGLDLSQISEAILIGNPDLVTHTLKLKPILYGIDPFWKVIIRKPGGGDPPPEMLGPGQTVELQVGLVPALQNGNTPFAPPANSLFGDESRVDVSVQLDDQEISGFTILIEPAVLDTKFVYLPWVIKQP